MPKGKKERDIHDQSRVTVLLAILMRATYDVNSGFTASCCFARKNNANNRNSNNHGSLVTSLQCSSTFTNIYSNHASKTIQYTIC